MTSAPTETVSVVVERDVPFPAGKVWRALTQPHLIAEWLMENDFVPAVDHRFTLRQEWGAVDCRVLAIEPETSLVYSWAAMGVETVVTWTLTPTGGGTHLRMEQTGFRADQPQNYNGARYGWGNFLGKLEEVLAKLD